MINVFLSASVPLPERDARFLETADIPAIREAVKGLVLATLPFGKIVFGGHPAITPLIALLLRERGPDYRSRVVLYQSKFFENAFVVENQEFLDVKMTPAIRSSREESLTEMRRRMLQETAFSAGVFIGGMEGVLQEYQTFKQLNPDVAIWPIASTGAAALEIFNQMNRPREELFLNELTYLTLFRKLIRERMSLGR